MSVGLLYGNSQYLQILDYESYPGTPDVVGFYWSTKEGQQWQTQASHLHVGYVAYSNAIQVVASITRTDSGQCILNAFGNDAQNWVCPANTPNEWNNMAADDEGRGCTKTNLYAVTE
jgi:hypothetical protein